jgi:hypothetical protein
MLIAVGTYSAVIPGFLAGFAIFCLTVYQLVAARRELIRCTLPTLLVPVTDKLLSTKASSRQDLLAGPVDIDPDLAFPTTFHLPLVRRWYSRGVLLSHRMGESISRIRTTHTYSVRRPLGGRLKLTG